MNPYVDDVYEWEFKRMWYGFTESRCTDNGV